MRRWARLSRIAWLVGWQETWISRILELGMLRATIWSEQPVDWDGVGHEDRGDLPTHPDPAHYPSTWAVACRSLFEPNVARRFPTTSAVILVTAHGFKQIQRAH